MINESPCKKCHWLKKLLCIIACPEVNDRLVTDENELIDNLKRTK